MRISIFGLGYVGVVSAACFSSVGHEVFGIDVQEAKVDVLNSGKSPVIESGLAEMIREQVAQGRLIATTDWKRAVCETDISLICVGTPSRSNGSLNLDFVYRVSEQIGSALANKNSYHVVALRSTTLPGASDHIAGIISDASGKKADDAFGVCYNPEFLREGSAVNDFFNPPFTVVGERTDGGRAGDMISACYQKVEAPLRRLDIRASELIKYASNSFHALKVAFANEIGSVCKALNVDSHQLMKLFISDSKLNTSSAYLMPGFAFGGSCLPKDVRAIVYYARQEDLKVPLLESIIPSNDSHIERGLDIIMAGGRRNIGIAGLSFKGGTDDIRESPIVTLTETLIGKGFPVRIYDHNIELSTLVGANKEFLEMKIPHITSLMVSSLDELVEFSDLVVIGNTDSEFGRLPSLLTADQELVDLVRIQDEDNALKGKYHGICW